MSTAILTPEQRAHYERSRAKGTSERLALMLATGKAPMLDRQSERWRLSNDGKRQGVSATGKYQAGIARFPNDPAAFVTSKNQAKEVAKRHGYEVSDRPMNHDNPAQRRTR